MKKLAKTAMTALAAALVSQGAQAAYNDDDLILGFNGNSGSSDYIINLGNANSVVGVGGTSLVDLSADFNRSTFNSVWASFVGTRVGVVGGQNSITLGVNAYETVLRLDGPGASAAVQGTESTPGLNNQTTKGKLQQDLSVIVAGNLSLGTAGAGVLDSAKTYSGKISSGTLNPNAWFGQQSVDPQNPLDSSGIIYEDLFYSTAGGAYAYQGYFTIDVSGSGGSITFTPKDLAAVPEPGTYGLMAGAVLLIFSLRNKFRRSVRPLLP